MRERRRPVASLLAKLPVSYVAVRRELGIELGAPEEAEEHLITVPVALAAQLGPEGGPKRGEGRRQQVRRLIDENLAAAVVGQLVAPGRRRRAAAVGFERRHCRNSLANLDFEIYKTKANLTDPKERRYF